VGGRAERSEEVGAQPEHDQAGLGTPPPVASLPDPPVVDPRSWDALTTELWIAAALLVVFVILAVWKE